MTDENKRDLPLSPGQLAIAQRIESAMQDEASRNKGRVMRLLRALESITLCATNAIETMDHGSDRYDLAVAVDNANEAMKETQ